MCGLSGIRLDTTDHKSNETLTVKTLDVPAGEIFSDLNSGTVPSFISLDRL